MLPDSDYVFRDVRLTQFLKPNAARVVEYESETTTVPSEQHGPGAYSSGNRSRRSLRRLRTLAYCKRSSLGNCCRVGGDRLFHKRSILREGPLQNRRNPLPTPQHHRRSKRAFDHLIRLERILARFRPDSGGELRSRMDLKEVLVMSDMAAGGDVGDDCDSGPVHAAV